MELLELLEHRIGDLLQELKTLREDNARLSASTEAIAQMREENRMLSESLEQERQLRSQIDQRIDMLLTSINGYETQREQH